MITDGYLLRDIGELVENRWVVRQVCRDWAALPRRDYQFWKLVRDREYALLKMIDYFSWNDRILRESVKDLTMFKYMQTCGIPARSVLTTYAAEIGNLECLQEAKKYGCEFAQNITLSAACGGDLSHLEHGRKYKREFGANTILSSHGYNNLQCLKYLYDQGCEITDEATCTPIFECAKYAFEKVGIWNNEAVRYAMMANNIEHIEYIRNTGGKWMYMIETAAEMGKLHFLDYARKHGCKDKYNVVLNGIISYNDVDKVKYVLEKGYNTHRYEHPYAKSFEMVKFILENITFHCEFSFNLPYKAIKYIHKNLRNFRWNYLIIKYAILRNDQKLVKYARSNHDFDGNICPWGCIDIVCLIKNNDFEFIKWVIENGCPVENNLVMYSIAKYGLLNYLQYFHQRGYAITSDVVKTLIQINYLVKLANFKNVKVTKKMINAFIYHDKDPEIIIYERLATKKINLSSTNNKYDDCLKYVIQNLNDFDVSQFTYQYNKHDFYRTLLKGDLPHIKYINEVLKEAKWNDKTMKLIAYGGNFDCLQYACENKCSWYDDVLIDLAEHGYFDCFQYALKNKCPINDKRIKYVFDCGRIEFIKEIFDYCDNFSENIQYEILTRVVKCNHINILKYLCSKGWKVNKRLLVYAIECDNFICAKYIHEKGIEITAEIIHFAHDMGSSVCLSYFKHIGCIIKYVEGIEKLIEDDWGDNVEEFEDGTIIPHRNKCCLDNDPNCEYCQYYSDVKICGNGH